MKIRKLHIQDYKVFDDVLFDFTDAEGKTLDTIVLAGVNGGGKTTVLELIISFYDEQRYISNSGSVDLELHAEEKMLFERLNYRFPFMKNTVSIPLDEFTKRDDLVRVFSFSLAKFSRPAIYMPASLKKTNIAYGLMLHLETNKDEMKILATKSIRDEVFKNKHTAPQIIIEKAINAINQTLSYFKLSTKLVDLESEELVFESVNGKRIYFEELSNGEKHLYFRAIYLYQLKLKNCIIMIDEPETSLHPTWQKEIIKLYQHIGENNQVIVATHSPHVMASVKPESLFLLHLQDHKVQVLNMAKEGKHSKGLEPNRILKEIMEVEMLRDYDTQQQIDELTKYLNINDFEKEKTQQLIEKLTNDLGRQDPFILKVNHQLLMLNRQKEKLANAPHS